VRLDPGLGSDPLEAAARRLAAAPLLAGRAGLLLAAVAVVASAGLLMDALPGLWWNFWRAAAFGVLGSLGAGWLLRRVPRLDPFVRGMFQGAAGVLAGLCAWMLTDGSRGAVAALLAGGAVLALGTGVLMGRFARWRTAYRAARDAVDERELRELWTDEDGSAPSAPADAPKLFAARLGTPGLDPLAHPPAEPARTVPHPRRATDAHHPHPPGFHRS
jgi:hypothetical protein